MNKKFIILGAIIFFTTGISLAAVLGFYVNMQGTAQIIGPEFYIGSADEETLLVNEQSPDCDYFNIDEIYRVFKTEDLEETNFSYIPSVRFSVRAKVGTTTSQDLILNFGYFDTIDSIHPVCSETVSLTNEMNNYTTDFTSCSEIPTNAKNFYYEFQKGCEDCDYTISKCEAGFYTKIEIQK